MTTTLRTIVAIAAAVAAGAVYAHHGWSEYDSANPVKLAGTIKQSGYEHPHGHVQIDSAGKTWHVVLAPPSRMTARGLAAANLKAGTQVEVVGYQNRNKPEEMRAERITVGGKTVELR